MKRRALLLTPFLAKSTQAHSLKSGGVKIGHAWALPGIAGLDGHCFMPLLNTALFAEALIAARSDICSHVELRQNAKYDHPAEMQFALIQNKPIAMRPQARHLRLVGLRRDLKLDGRFKLILDFLNAGEVEVEVYIENTPGE